MNHPIKPIAAFSSFMKSCSLIAFIILISILPGCKPGSQSPDEMSKEIEKLNQEKLSLEQEAMAKDSSINSFLESFNVIQSNLDSIKGKTKTVSLNMNDAEAQKTQQQKIVDDINFISELLAKNKQIIASLTKKLKNANFKIEEIQKMVDALTKQVEEKDAEIVSLKEKLTATNASLESLFVTYQQTVSESEEKSVKIDEQTNKMNTAYYAWGTSKELIKQGVLTKEGGFIGLGKAEKLKDNFNKDYFTKIDITKTNSLEIFMKKAKMVTTHPSNSYKFEGTDKKVDKLIILNSEEFWSASKFLVIVVE